MPRWSWTRWRTRPAVAPATGVDRANRDIEMSSVQALLSIDMSIHTHRPGRTVSVIFRSRLHSERLGGGVTARRMACNTVVLRECLKLSFRPMHLCNRERKMTRILWIASSAAAGVTCAVTPRVTSRSAVWRRFEAATAD